ncbi:MAG: UDP-N-acetylmuramate dehydrogenase [bacterium]|nr:UDP-N-acetylmuramate dehydrogenase [bacterium]
MILKKSKVPISSLTSFKNKGTINNLILFHNIEEISDFIRHNKGSAYFILGKGSNLIINPRSEIKTFIKILPSILPFDLHNSQLKINAGFSTGQMISLTRKNNLSGLEFAAGVPASLGGMIYMNFGCWGQSISNIIEKVHIIDEKGESRWLCAKDCQFGYRYSIFKKQKWIITEAIINLEKSSSEKIKENISQNIKRRLKTQPLNSCTFGSIFQNPEDLFAAKILEENGFKGYNFKSLKISEKHANFMVNKGDAEFSEILNFINLIKDKIKYKTNINLELEVEIVI